jgi:hypothetical protein
MHRLYCLTSRHQAIYVLVMRTTLTIDDDVAAEIERLQKTEDKSHKEVVNQALRRGLFLPPKETRFYTKPMDLGECLIGNIDCIHEALTVAEGEDYR